MSEQRCKDFKSGGHIDCLKAMRNLALTEFRKRRQNFINKHREAYFSYFYANFLVHLLWKQKV